MAANILEKKYDAVIPTPFRDLRLGLSFSDDVLVGVDFLDQNFNLHPPTSQAQKKVVQELQHYFSDPTYRFDFELLLQGTQFQKRVWQALYKIPAGKTLSYGELAKQLGTSARAIGNACRTNKIPIVIPCHRIVAKTGLGGFMGHRKGSELDIKQWLLQHEHALDGS
jgi:methylated-DNA-[protein]-cysteine S-methyltransferase